MVVSSVACGHSRLWLGGGLGIFISNLNMLNVFYVNSCMISLLVSFPDLYGLSF